MEPDLVVLRVVGWGGLARCIHVMSTGLPYLQPCSCLWKMVSPGPLITDHHIKVDFFDSSFQKKVDLFDSDEVIRRRRKWC
jgi:hypothetical protein